MTCLRPGAVVLILCCSSVTQPKAEIADFYRGKQIRIVVGSDAGGGYDAYARAIAAHLGRFIPGQPSVIVQNMPGVGSLIAVNHVTNVAPHDGTVIAAINPAAVTMPLFHPDQARFDPALVHWLGTPVTIAYTAVVWRTAPVQRFDQLFTTELIVASAGGASRTLPLLSNGVLGTKFKVVEGYKSASAGMLAMERGEVEGNGGQALNNLKAVHGELMKNGSLRIIASYTLRPNPELSDVPMVVDYATTAEKRAALTLVLASQDIGWPYIMASAVPADRAETMRRAFAAVMRDPQFRAEAARRKLDLSPARGEEQARLVGQILRTPSAVVEQVKRIVGDP